jgi:hypothetical protein
MRAPSEVELRGFRLTVRPSTAEVEHGAAPRQLWIAVDGQLIEVTLPPGSAVKPDWPFQEFCDEATAAALAERPDDSRDRLAALITAPQNERFAQVMVNRIWQRFMGRGADAEVPVQILTDLETDAGEQITYDLLAELKMAPVEGDDTLFNIHGHCFSPFLF